MFSKYFSDDDSEENEDFLGREGFWQPSLIGQAETQFEYLAGDLKS